MTVDQPAGIEQHDPSAPVENATPAPGLNAAATAALADLTQSAKRFLAATDRPRVELLEATLEVVGGLANLIRAQHGHAGVTVEVAFDPAGGMPYWLAHDPAEDENTHDALHSVDDPAFAGYEEGLVEVVEAAILTMHANGYPADHGTWGRWTATIPASA